LREAFLAVDQDFLSSLARDVTLVRKKGGKEGGREGGRGSSLR
jgi:hypothetical protein